MRKQKMQVRHGDVYLRQAKLPEGARPVRMERPEVLAYGEVTGHSHRIEGATVERYERDGNAYVLLSAAGVLAHEEHGQAALPAGAYEVLIERDYDPSVYARRVVD